ncbi:hypothetical protein IT575_12890 [bacterium]|nr:hypothetical protein [bacterium]
MRGNQGSYSCRPFALLLMVLLGTALCACSSSRESVTPAASVRANTPADAALPLMPGHGLQEREASGSFSHSAKSRFPWASSDDAKPGTEPLHHIKLGPAPEGFSWAIYSFNLGSQLLPLLTNARVTLQHTAQSAPEAQSRLWLGYADYADSAWKLQGYSSGSGTAQITLPGGSAAVSPNGYVYVLVLVAEGDAQWVTGDLLLESDCADFELSLSSSSSALSLSWNSIPGAAGYRLLYRQLGPDAGEFSTLIELPSQQLSFEHSLSQPEGKPCVWDTPYEYRIEALLGGAVMLDCAEPLAGRRVLQTPEVSVSDDFSSSFLRVDWSAVPDATGYALYRDSTTDPMLEFGPGQLSFTDTDPQILDGIRHYYRVEAMGPEGNSGQGIGLGRVQSFASFLLDPASELDSAALELAQFQVSGTERSIACWRDAQSGNPKLAWALTDNPQEAGDFTLQELLTDGLQGGSYSAAAPLAAWYGLALARPTGGLAFMRPKNLSPAAAQDWNLCDVDSAEGRGVQLAADGGIPVLAYVNSADELVLARASGASPLLSSDWTRFVVDTDGKLGDELSLLVEDGRPILAYRVDRDEADLELNAMRLAVASSPQPDSAGDFSVYEPMPGAQILQRPELNALSNRLELGFFLQSPGGADIWQASSLSLQPLSASEWSFELLHCTALQGDSQRGLSFHADSAKQHSLAYLAEHGDGTAQLRLLRLYSPLSGMPFLQNDELLQGIASGPQSPQLDVIWPANGMRAVVSMREQQDGPLSPMFVEEL